MRENRWHDVDCSIPSRYICRVENPNCLTAFPTSTPTTGPSLTPIVNPTAQPTIAPSTLTPVETDISNDDGSQSAKPVFIIVFFVMLTILIAAVVVYKRGKDDVAKLTVELEKHMDALKMEEVGQEDFIVASF